MGTPITRKTICRSNKYIFRAGIETSARCAESIIAQPLRQQCYQKVKVKKIILEQANLLVRKYSVFAIMMYSVYT